MILQVFLRLNVVKMLHQVLSLTMRRGSDVKFCKDGCDWLLERSTCRNDHAFMFSTHQGGTQNQFPARFALWL